MSIRFDNRVAIVTGAGGGLGRSHALALAARGAKVLVNDFGGALDGTDGGSDAAQAVVAEIETAGGAALANGADVSSFEQVEAMVAAAVAAFGRVDILVNNAGILRDKTFVKMTMADFRAVVDVHLIGSANCSKAVWAQMREQNYGRIVFTTSSSGLYGNFGQANYGAAKLAVVGLMNTLHLEGKKYDIRVNSLSPVAATRMTEGLMPPEALALLRPAAVTAGLLVLVGEDAPSRQILAAGAGGFARASLVQTQGIHLDGDDCTPENLQARWDEMTDPDNQDEPQQGAEQSMKFIAAAAAARGVKIG